MDHNAFKVQIERLSKEFGGKGFSTEKVSLIWEEVKNLQERDLIDIVSGFIADSTYAPKRKDFRDAIIRMRLNNYESQKKVRANEGKKLTPENHKMGMRILSGVMGGEFTKEQIEEWVRSTKAQQLSCKHCDDRGLVFAREKGTKYENFAFKCF